MFHMQADGGEPPQNEESLVTSRALRLLDGGHVERKPKEQDMDTEDFRFTEEELAAAILEEHESALFDDELEGF
jgi:hypothetical protein